MKTIDQITRAVCDYMKTPYDEVRGRGRSQYIAQSRMICYYFASLLTNNSTTQIGIYFDRDHTSVIYGRESIHDRIDTQPVFRNMMKKIETLLAETPPTQPPLQWTKLKPEVPGWYFYRPAPGTTRVGLLVKMNNEEAVFDAPGGYGRVRNLEGDWAGPIAEPREEKK